MLLLYVVVATFIFGRQFSPSELQLATTSLIAKNLPGYCIKYSIIAGASTTMSRARLVRFLASIAVHRQTKSIVSRPDRLPQPSSEWPMKISVYLLPLVFLVHRRFSSSTLLRGTIINTWYLVGPNIAGENSEIYRFLSVPQVVFNVVPRNTTGSTIELFRSQKLPRLTVSTRHHCGGTHCYTIDTALIV